MCSIKKKNTFMDEVLSNAYMIRDFDLYYVCMFFYAIFVCIVNFMKYNFKAQVAIVSLFD